MALVLFRPTPTPSLPNLYTVVGESQVQTLSTASGLKVFTLVPKTTDPPIAAQGGDLLGYWVFGAVGGCFNQTQVAGDQADVRTGTKPTVGTQLPLTPVVSGSPGEDPGYLRHAHHADRADCAYVHRGDERRLQR